MGVQIYLWDLAIILLYIYISRSESTISYDSFIFNFWGFSVLFYILTTQIYIPTSDAWGFPFLHILVNPGYCCWFDNCSRYKVISHCAFYLHFPEDSWYWTSFHGNLYVTFEEMSVQVFCTFLNWIVCFLNGWVLGIFWILIPCHMYHL